MKLAGGDAASLFAGDAGWNTGHASLPLAARAEDKTDVGFNSARCV